MENQETDEDCAVVRVDVRGGVVQEVTARNVRLPLRVEVLDYDLDSGAEGNHRDPEGAPCCRDVYEFAPSGPLWFVVEREYGVDWNGYLSEQVEDRIVACCPDQTSAERTAARLLRLRIRGLCPHGLGPDFDSLLADGYSVQSLPVAADFASRLSAILGEPIRADDVVDGCFQLPWDLTVEQAVEIAGLLRPKFVWVSSAEFVSDPDERCVCELPGWFCSGVPGILAHITPGQLPDRGFVERCDQCRRFASDEEAWRHLRALGNNNRSP